MKKCKLTELQELRALVALNNHIIREMMSWSVADFKDGQRAYKDRMRRRKKDPRAEAVVDAVLEATHDLITRRSK